MIYDMPQDQIMNHTNAVQTFPKCIFPIVSYLKNTTTSCFSANIALARRADYKFSFCLTCFRISLFRCREEGPILRSWA